MIDVPVLVKEALKDGRLKKNYRFIVLNNDDTEDFTIDNDNLVAESVNIDERMCSGDMLKFGLCEGSNLEFQYFEKPNITGRRVQAFIDVQNDSIIWSEEADLSATDYNAYTITHAGIYEVIIPANQTTPLHVICYHDGQDVGRSVGISNVEQIVYLGELSEGDEVSLSSAFLDEPFTARLNSGVYWYSIPLGFFDVKKCSRQASTGIIKATCYNKLQSDYLDAKANSLIEDIQSDSNDPNMITIKTIQDLLLQDYEIIPKEIVTVAGGVGTTATYLNSAPSFKIRGSSSTYYPFIANQLLTFWNLDVTKRYKLKFNDYLLKLKEAISSLKATIDVQVYNASTFWQNFTGTSLYQTNCTVTVIYGSGNIINGFFCLEDENPTIIIPQVENHGVLEKLEYLYGVSHISFTFPIQFGGSTSSSSYQNTLTIWNTNERVSLDDIIVEEVQTDDIETIEISKVDLADVTLRDIINANYELHCQFGQLSRITDLFSGVELNHSRLYPATTLYPATDLHPGGAVLSANKSMYSKLWADEGNVHKWRYLIITYKGLDGEGNETDYTLQRTVNADGTDNYNMSDNWLFRNLIWTAEQVGDYADAMVTKMQDVTWFPFEMWCAGLPYLETGDEIEISVGNESYTSYILQRQMKGIQNLQDTYINGTLDIF